MTEKAQDTEGTDVPDSIQPDPPTSREDIEKALIKFIDNFYRELVKLKMVQRPKGSTPKETKVKDLIDLCAQDDHDALLEKTCELMKKNKMDKMADDLRLIARPPRVEEEEEEMAEEQEEENEAELAEESPEEEEEPKEEVPPAKSYKEVIDECMGTFVDCLVIDKHILEYLQNNAVINEEMRSKITCRPTRHEKVRIFMGFMRGLGPQSLHVLIDALRQTKQDFLANILSANVFT